VHAASCRVATGAPVGGWTETFVHNLSGESVAARLEPTFGAATATTGVACAAGILSSARQQMDAMFKGTEALQTTTNSRVKSR